MAWTPPEVKSVTLERHLFQQRLLKTRFGNEVEYLRRDEIDHVEHQFRLQILGTKPEVVERSWPATWLDAFIERWAPKWLRRLFPRALAVHYSNIHVVKAGLYPEIPARHGERYTTIAFVEAREWGSVR